VTWLWILLGLGGWLLVAVVVGFVVGSATRLGELAGRRPRSTTQIRTEDDERAA
jgi:Sec-independent protein translocase protein TatA